MSAPNLVPGLPSIYQCADLSDQWNLDQPPDRDVAESFEHLGRTLGAGLALMQLRAEELAAERMAQNGGG